MSVMNKRNAVIGWVAWNVAKTAATRKAKQSIRLENGHGRSKLVAPAMIAAAVGGAVFLWRRLQNGDGDGHENGDGDRGF